jgi:glycosyltransferase involved in cell wall biosynthesis
MNVTAVIPVRNRADLISRALESVASQTYPAEEIIVVDDASTDGTSDIVMNLAKTINNLRLITLKENVGAAEARNVGIQQAKGDLIAFLDSDDRWYPEKLEKQLNEFRSDDDVVAVFSGSVVINDDSSFRYTPRSDITPIILYHSNALGTLSSAVISKKALVQIGGFDRLLPSCQDWDLYIRLARLGKFRVVQQALIEYSDVTNDRISRNKSSVFIGHNIVYKKIYNEISDPALLKSVRGSHECIMADYFSYNIFEPGSAIKHSLKGLALAPSLKSLRIFARVIKRIVVNSSKKLRR